MGREIIIGAHEMPIGQISRQKITLSICILLHQERNKMQNFYFIFSVKMQNFYITRRSCFCFL